MGLSAAKDAVQCTTSTYSSTSEFENVHRRPEVKLQMVGKRYGHFLERRLDGLLDEPRLEQPLKTAMRRTLIVRSCISPFPLAPTTGIPGPRVAHQSEKPGAPSLPTRDDRRT